MESSFRILHKDIIKPLAVWDDIWDWLSPEPKAYNRYRLCQHPRAKKPSLEEGGSFS